LPVSSLSWPAPHPALLAFPTRRSSDLTMTVGAMLGQAGGGQLVLPQRHLAQAGALRLQHAVQVGDAHAAATKGFRDRQRRKAGRSEEHTSELQSREKLVCRLPLEKNNT